MGFSAGWRALAVRIDQGACGLDEAKKLAKMITCDKAGCLL